MNPIESLVRRAIALVLVPGSLVLATSISLAGSGHPGPAPGKGDPGPSAAIAAPDDEDEEEEEEKKDDDEKKEGDDEEKTDDEKKKEEEAKSRIKKILDTKGVDEWTPQDPDARFVKENLKEFIHGTISFDRDGTTTIEYDFKKKLQEHQNDFQPPISAKSAAPFRWSVRQEEYVQGGSEGIRISDKGAAILKDVWFDDDVEATIEYINGITWTSRHVCIVFLQAKSGKGLGNNFGGQLASLQNGAYKGGVPAATEAAQFGDTVKIGIRLKKGICEVLRGGKARQTQKYPTKSMASCRVGLNWGGSIAGTITSLTVKGKLDIPAMMKVMRGKK